MTDAGRQLRQDVLATSAQVTGPVLAAVDRGDLEVTIRTLDEITRRVRETFGTEGS
jgi:predicted transcriptional regulator